MLTLSLSKQTANNNNKDSLDNPRHRTLSSSNFGAKLTQPHCHKQDVAKMASHLARIWQSVLFQEPSADRVLSIDPVILNELDPQDFWALTQMYS